MGALAPLPPTDPRGPLFLADQPLPALLLPAFFLFLILCSETAPKHLLCRLLTYDLMGSFQFITRGGSQILFLLKEIAVCIVLFCVALLSLRVV